MQTAPLQQQDSSNTGRWTRQEHQRFLQGLELYGRDWKRIQILVGSRNGAQIRSHAQKYFIKTQKQSPLDSLTPPEQTPNTPTSGDSLHIDHSYFMERIVGSGVLEGSGLDFWRLLVDWKGEETQGDQRERKMSFVSVGGLETVEEEEVVNEADTVSKI